MAKFKDYLKLVESRRFLAEANVINMPKVEAYVARFVTATKPEPGKQWITKKVRAYLINDESLLEPADKEKAMLYPEFAQEAIRRGETVYEFNPTGQVGRLYDHIQHVVDWFNSMDELLSRPPRTDIEKQDYVLTQKEMTKVMKLNFAQGYEAADAWFNHMGSRLKTGAAKTVEGADVVMEWPDGFYAVSYTSETAMREDGRDLQNCLQNAHYWPHVESGWTQVYGIRKPNDEAVIGIRVTLRDKRLQECKGKNNKPVTERYIQYAADFLNKMGLSVPMEGNNDLRKAGLTFHNGRFGTFDDIADVLFNADGLVIKATDDRYLAQMGSTVVTGNKTFDKLSSFAPLNAPTGFLLRMCRGLKLAPGAVVKRQLESLGIFYNDGSWGDITEVATHIGEAGGFDVYHLVNGMTAEYIVMARENRVLVVHAKDGKLQSFHINAPDARPLTDICDVLAATCSLSGLGCTENMLVGLLNTGIGRVGAKYVKIAKACPMDVYDEAAEIEVRKGGNKKWFVGKGTYVIVAMNTKGQLVLGSGGDSPSDDISGALQKLVDKYHFSGFGASQHKHYGLLPIQGRLIGGVENFFEHLPEIERHWRAEGVSPWALSREVLEYFESTLVNSHEDPSIEQVSKLMTALRPSHDKPVLIREVAKQKVRDLPDVNTYAIMLPLANVQTFGILMRDLPHVVSAMPQAAVEDLKRGIDDATKYVLANPLHRYEISMGSFKLVGTIGKVAPMSELWGAVDTSKEKLHAMFDSLRASAPDMSSRFAALNGLRSVKGS